MKRKIIFLVLSVILSKVSFSQDNCDACEMLKNNVVKIRTSFSDGSDENGFGTIIAERGDKLYIVTAKHVIYKLDERGNKSLEINPQSVIINFYSDQGKDYQAQLLSLSNNSYDITLLEVTKPQILNWTKDYYSDAVKRGTKVWFIGSADDWYIPTEPKSGAINRISINDEIIIDINSIQPGTSGAPLISKNGMVGVIFEDASTGAKAYPLNKVKSIITGWGYEWQLNLNSTGDNDSEITKKFEDKLIAIVKDCSDYFKTSKGKDLGYQRFSGLIDCNAYLSTVSLSELSTDTIFNCSGKTWNYISKLIEGTDSVTILKKFKEYKIKIEFALPDFKDLYKDNKDIKSDRISNYSDGKTSIMIIFNSTPLQKFEIQVWIGPQ